MAKVALNETKKSTTVEELNEAKAGDYIYVPKGHTLYGNLYLLSYLSLTEDNLISLSDPGTTWRISKSSLGQHLKAVGSLNGARIIGLGETITITV